MTGEYLKTMEKIYKTAKIVSLPESYSQDGTKSGGGGSDVTRELIKAMIVAKEAVGSAGEAGGGNAQMSEDADKKMKKLQSLINDLQEDHRRTAEEASMNN